MVEVNIEEIDKILRKYNEKSGKPVKKTSKRERKKPVKKTSKQERKKSEQSFQEFQSAQTSHQPDKEQNPKGDVPETFEEVTDEEIRELEETPKDHFKIFNRTVEYPERISGTPTILYYDTDYTCKLIRGKIKGDGSFRIDERTFDFTKGKPAILTVKRKGGRNSTHPFYLLKYDNMNPINIAKTNSSVPTPEEATRLINLRTLETLSRIEGGKMRKAPLLILMIIGVVIGFLTAFFLIKGGYF